MLKLAHDRWGVKTQLNLFFRTDYFYGNDEFTLADMTDAYKPEWEAASDWLHLSFHDKQEFPGFAFLNITYREMTDLLSTAEREIRRFAGEKAHGSRVSNPHWPAVSCAGCQALYAHGVRLVNVTASDRVEYSTETAKRVPGNVIPSLLCRRTPEAALVPGRSICLAGHNHLTTEQESVLMGTSKYLIDPQTGLAFKPFISDIILNKLTADEVRQKLAGEIGRELICANFHEQYFYPEYFRYRPDCSKNIHLMSQLLCENGYEFIFLEDLVY